MTSWTLLNKVIFIGPGAFLDLQKTFDWVYYKGLRYKLKCNEINGSLLCLLDIFLTDRQQRSILNGQSSNWKNIKSVFTLGIGCCSTFVRNLCLWFIYRKVYIPTLKYLLMIRHYFKLWMVLMSLHPKLNNNLISIQDWEYSWKISVNPDRAQLAQEGLFSGKSMKYLYPNLYFNNLPIVKTTSSVVLTTTIYIVKTIVLVLYC